MTSWNLQPWQLKATSRAINIAESTITTNASSSCYHLNIDYNKTKEIVELKFIPPANQTKKEIKHKIENRNKTNRHCAKANQICNDDMVKQTSTSHDISNKSVQVPSTVLHNEREKHRSRKRNSPSTAVESLAVTDSVNTNIICESNYLTAQKDGKVQKVTSITRKTDRKKEHKHGREHSQDTFTLTDGFSVRSKAALFKTKKHKHRRERIQAATISKNISRENCEDPTLANVSQKHKRTECSQETLAIIGTFSQTNFEDQMKLSNNIKKEALDDKENSKEICTKHKKKSKRRAEKGTSPVTQQEQLLNETVSGENAHQLCFFKSALQNTFDGSVLKTKSKDSLIKPTKSRRKRKQHLSRETQGKDIQNTTSSSSGKCNSRESCAAKEALHTENKKEGIRFFFIRNKKGNKVDQKKNTDISKTSKTGDLKHGAKSKQLSSSNQLEDVEDAKKKLKKVTAAQQNETIISYVSKNRSKSVDAKTFKKGVDRDSLETLRCIGDVKLNKTSKTIRGSIQEESYTKLRHSRSETNIKHEETEKLMLRATKENLVGDQKPETSKRRSNINKDKNERKDLTVESGVEKKKVQIEGTRMIDKLLFKKRKKNKSADAATEARSLKNEKLESELENEGKTQDNKVNLNTTNMLDTQDCRACENCKKLKRSKKETERIHSGERKSPKHRTTESTGTGEDGLDKKHHKSRKSDKHHHKLQTTIEESEEIPKKEVPDLLMEVQRKSRRRKENPSKSTVQDQTASATDNSVVVYQLATQKNCFSGINFEDKQLAEENAKNKKLKNDSKKIIKIRKEQLEEIINQINKKHNLQRSKTMHLKLPCSNETATELNELRKEVSFSQLNLKPVIAYYASPTTTFNSLEEKQFDSISTYNSTLSFPIKEKKQSKPKKKSKVTDRNSVVSEAVTKKEKFQYVCGRRYSTNRAARNFAYSESVFESSRKALRGDNSSNVGFIVEGIEPPRMLKPNVPSVTKQCGNIQRELRVAIVSVIAIPPKYEEGLACAANHNLISERKEIRRSLSLLNAADGNLTEGVEVSDVSEKEQLPRRLPHTQTFTSLASVRSRGASVKSSTSRKPSLKSQDAAHAIEDINLNDNTVINFSRQNAAAPESSLGIFTQLETATCSGDIFQPTEEISSRVYKNRHFFEEEDLDKTQFTALGEEVFNRMKQYLKEVYKLPAEEHPVNEAGRKSLAKEQPSGIDKTVRSRMNKYAQDLADKRKRLSRGSSASSRKSVDSTKYSSLEKRDTKSSLADETNRRRSLSRNSLNNYVSSKSISPKRDLNTPVHDRATPISKRRDSTSTKEGSTGNSKETKNLKRNHKPDTASREHSPESRRARLISLAERKRSISARPDSADRKRRESEDSVAITNDVSRQTSNESVLSKSNQKHTSRYDRLTMKSKRRSSVSTERKSIEDKYYESDKTSRIPRRVSQDSRRNVSSDRDGSLERKINKKQGEKSPGSTSSELSTKDQSQKRSSKSQATKEIKNSKLHPSDDSKKVKTLKGARTLLTSETFLWDSVSGELGNALKEEDNIICNEDATALAKITEESSSENSLSVAYSHLPEKLENNNKEMTSNLNKHLKLFKYTPEEIELMKPLLTSSIAEALQKESCKASAKHNPPQSKKLHADKKNRDDKEEHLQYLSKQVFDNILGVLNLNSKSEGKQHFLFNSNVPVPIRGGSEENELVHDQEGDKCMEYLSKLNMLPKEVINVKPYYENGELQKGEIDNRTDKDFVINFSSSTVRQTKKSQVQQGGAPEIICSSCSINVQPDFSDVESGNFDNKSSKIVFKDDLNVNDSSKKTSKKPIQISEDSLENNPAAKCGISNCIPKIKSKIPLKREGESGKSIHKCNECQRPIGTKEGTEKSAVEENMNSTKTRDKSIKRDHQESKGPIQEVEAKDTTKKSFKQTGFEKVIDKNPNNETSGQKRCTTSDCAKLIDGYINEKEKERSIEANQKPAQNTRQKESDEKSQTKEKDGRRKQCNNSECSKLIEKYIQEKNTSDANAANEDVNVVEVQRLSTLVKQNVMKELEAAHLLKPIMMHGKLKKQQQLDGIIERSIATALSQRNFSVMCVSDVDESAFSTIEANNTPRQQGSTYSEIPETNQRKSQVSEKVMGANQQIAQEHKEIIGTPIQNVAVRQTINQDYNLNINPIKNPQKKFNAEGKRDALLEKLAAMMSSEPDCLRLESRLDKLLGIKSQKTGNKTESSNMSDEAGSTVVMHMQTPKNAFNGKKANHVAYTVPARKCKVRRSRLKINPSQEFNPKGKTTDVTTSNISNTRSFVKQEKTNSLTTSDNFKKENKNSSNPCSQSISRIPKLIKSVSTKLVPTLLNSVAEAIEENAPGDLQEPSSPRCVTKLLDIEIVEPSENQTITNSSSKIASMKAKPQTSLCSNSTSGKALSSYEKRKMYGERLRFKKTNSKNEPALTPFTESEKGKNEDCIYCYPRDGRLTSRQSKKDMSPSRLPLPKFSNQRYRGSSPEEKTSPSGSYVYKPHTVIGDDLDSNADLDCFYCNPEAEANEGRLKMPGFSSRNKYPSPASESKPSGSGRKQSSQGAFAQDERTGMNEREERIYQAYSVLADHPNVTDVFRNKFKAESSVSLLSGDSTYSCDNDSPCNSPRSSCSLNAFHRKTLHKSSSLLNTNYYEEVHHPYEAIKRLNSCKRFARGHRERKRNHMGAAATKMGFCSPSKEFFSTIEQNINDTKDVPEISPLNLTSSYEFYHSTPNYIREVENRAERMVPFCTRSARIPRRKVSLLEACQHLRNTSLGGRHCNEYVESADNAILNSSNKNTLFNSTKRHRFKNVNKKTFFKDTKSLIYQSLDRTSKILGSLTPKTCSSPYSTLSNQYYQENGHSECDLAMPYVELDALKQAFVYNNVAGRVRKTPMVKTIKRRDGHGQPRNTRLQSLRDLSSSKDRNRNHHVTQSPTLTRRQNCKCVENSNEQRARSKNKRSYENNENIVCSSKDEEGSYTIFKLDKDFQIHRKHKPSLDKNQSEECFKIFAYNNIIELDMDYPPLYYSSTDKAYVNNSFLFSNMEKSKSFPQNFVYEKERTEKKKGERSSSTSVTPISEKTESGYGSGCKSKKSRTLRKFFPQQNVLDTFTSTFRCFDQEIYVGKRVTTFPVNTSTYSKTCSRPLSDSCPTEYDSRPNSGQRQRRRLLKDSASTSDYSDIPTDTYMYEQSSTSKFNSGRVTRPVSYFYNVGIERSDQTCTSQEHLEEISNQNRRSRSNLVVELDMGQPSSSNNDRESSRQKLYGSHDYEESKANNDKTFFPSKGFRSRIPHKIKPRFRTEPDELAEQFSSVCDKHKRFLFLRQKLIRNYGRKESQNSNKPNVHEEAPFYANYRHAPSKKVYEKYAYQRPNEDKLLQNRVGNFSQTDEHKRLRSNESEIWESEPSRRTGGRFKELIRSISRPFHISKKLDQDGLAVEQSSTYTISTKDSESNQKYFRFDNNKNGNTNCDLSPKPSEASLRDIAVGMSDTRCNEAKNLTYLQKQVNQCHEFVNKVCTESRLRKERHLKQFSDFKEIPLSILLGKNPPKSTESGRTNASFHNRTSRPKLKILDNDNDSKEVFELKSLSEEGPDKMSCHKLADKFKKNYTNNESVKNVKDGSTLESKPFSRSGKNYTKESSKTLANLRESSECKKEPCKGLRNFLKKSECTRDAYNDLRNALKESECTEAKCTNLRDLLQELREAFLEGTEGATINLKNVSKESIIPLKELLDMEFQKLLGNPDERGPSNELSTELMRLRSDTTTFATTSSLHSMKELLELPYNETIQANSTLPEDPVVPLRQLLDRVFDELVSSASKNSNVSAKPSTHFIKSPRKEPSPTFPDETNFSPSESTLTDSLNVPLIKLSKSPGNTSLTNSSHMSEMESAGITRRTAKEVEIDVATSPKALKDSRPGYSKSALKDLSKESKELLQVTLQKVLSHSKDNLEMVPTVADKKKKQSVQEPLQFPASKSKAMPFNDLRKLTNKPSSDETSFNDESFLHSTETITKNLQCLSKESKELLGDIFQKLLTLSQDSVGKSQKKFIALPTEVSVKNPGKHFPSETSKSPSEYSERIRNSANQLSEDPKEELLQAFEYPMDSETLLDTATKDNTPSSSRASDESLKEMETKGTFEGQSEQGSQNRISPNLPFPTEMILKELLQYHVKVSTHPPMPPCTKCLTRSNRNANASSKKSSPIQESLTGPPKERMDKEDFRNLSLQDIFKESPNTLLYVSKYLMSIMKEPLSTEPKEAIIQILKSLADNLSKESREDLYPNIQNLFNKTEPEEVQPTSSLATEPSESLLNYLEEPLDLSIKEPSMQTSNSFELVPRPAEAALKESSMECTKCKKLRKSKHPVDAMPKEASEKPKLSLKGPSEGRPEFLPSQCTKSTCKRYTKYHKEVPSPGSLNADSNNLPETSKELLEEVVQNLISLSEEAVTSKEMLKGVLSLAEEIGGSREVAVLPQEMPLDESSHSASNLPLVGCTKSTCKKIKRSSKERDDIPSKEASVPKSESPTSMKRASSGEIAGLTSPTETLLIQESRHSSGAPLQCTPSTCLNLIKSPNESLYLTPKEGSVLGSSVTKTITSDEVAGASPDLESPPEIQLKGDSIHSSKTPLQCTKSTCTNYPGVSAASADLPPQEAPVQALDSAAVKDSNEAVKTLDEMASNGESQHSLKTPLKCTRSTCCTNYAEEAAVLPPKEASVQVLDAASTKEMASNDAISALDDSQSPPKGESQHSPETPLKCTKSTCTNFAKVSEECSDLPPEQAALQVVNSESPTSIRDTSPSDYPTTPTDSKSFREVSLKEESRDSIKTPLQCTRSTCTSFVKTAEESVDLPSEETSAQGLNSESPTSIMCSPSNEAATTTRDVTPSPLQCTKSTCTTLAKSSNESVDTPPKETSVQASEPPACKAACAKEAAASTDQQSLPKEESLHSPKTPIQCTRSTCTHFTKQASVEVLQSKSNSPETSSKSIGSFKSSRELLEEAFKTLSIDPSRETLEETFVRLLSLSKETIAEEAPSSECTNSTCKFVTKPPEEPAPQDLKLSPSTSTKDTSDTASANLKAAPPNTDSSKCSRDTCGYLRNLSKESRELLEGTVKNLIMASKTSLPAVPEEPPQAAELLSEELSNKHSQDATQEVLPQLESKETPAQEESLGSACSMCSCGQHSSDCVCPTSEEADETPKPGENLSNILNNETPSYQSRRFSTPEKISLGYMQEIASVPRIFDQSRESSQLDEPFLESTPIESPEGSIRENGSMEGQFKTTPTSLCGNLISSDEESRELLHIPLQDQSVSSQKCTCAGFARLSQESVQLANTVFPNLPTISEQCFNVQINEQPRIMESFSGTSSTGTTGIMQRLTKDSVDLTKYFLADLAHFPKQSKEFFVAFHEILNAAQATNMLSKHLPQEPALPTRKTCRRCKGQSGPDTAEVPEELFKQLCGVTLKTMMELYHKVQENADLNMTFKGLVEELCTSKLKEGNLSDVSTQSQLNLLMLMKKYSGRSKDCACPSKGKMSKRGKIEKKDVECATDENKMKDVKDAYLSTTKEEVGKDSLSQTKNLVQSFPTTATPPNTEKEIIPKPAENVRSADKEKEIPKPQNNAENISIITISSNAEGATLKSEESYTDLEFKTAFGKAESPSPSKEQKNPLKELRDSLTDKELFEKLLDSYEKEENIVDRLSNDEEFFQSQLELVKSKESVESLMKTKAKIMKQSEERLLAALNLGSFSDLSEPKLPRKMSTPIPPPQVESTQSTEKRQSRSGISGFKSKMANLFKSDAVKEIVAPRSDGYKNSVDVSYLGKNSESYTAMNDDEQELGHRNLSNEDLPAEDSQKVKFTGGQRFHEEKKFIAENNEDISGAEARKTSRGRKSSIDSISNVVKPSDLGKCFLRGFRSDYVSLGGDTCLLIGNQEKLHTMQQREESYIEFSERDTPLEYLLALGFSIDEASNAIKDEDVKNRLFAAITEARIWINKISTVQGTLLYLIAYKAKPRIMRYYLQLVEAIINRRIQNAVKLDAFLRVLEKVEDGDLTMVNIVGSDKFDDEENEEKMVKKQLRQLFINVYKTAENEATLKNKPLSKEAVILLRILAAKYRAGLHPHLELIARYIGQGLLRNEVQLEAAMIYLSRLDTADVNLNEFERYCGIVCKENKTSGSATKLS